MGGKRTPHLTGAPVKRDPGCYVITVKDRSRRLNSHPRGPGLNKTTGRPSQRGTLRWSVRLAPGHYTFHPPTGHAVGGSFRIG